MSFTINLQDLVNMCIYVGANFNSEKKENFKICSYIAPYRKYSFSITMKYVAIHYPVAKYHVTIQTGMDYQWHVIFGQMWFLMCNIYVMTTHDITH